MHEDAQGSRQQGMHSVLQEAVLQRGSPECRPSLRVPDCEIRGLGQIA